MKKIFIIISILILSAANVYALDNTTEAILQYNKGIDYYKTGQYDDSVSAFRAAIKLDPEYIDAYYNLGSVLEYLQQYDAALAVFKQIIVRKPDDYDSVYKAAWLSAKLGEVHKAKSYLSIIPATSPRGKDARSLGNSLELGVPYTPVSGAQKKLLNQDSGIYEDIPAPTGIASDNEGNVYVAEFNNNAIVKVTPDNKKMVYLKDAKISGPIGLAIDKSGNMYIANYNKDNVLKIAKDGEISILLSNVKKPYCLYIVGNILLVSCQGSDSVLRYRLD